MNSHLLRYLCGALCGLVFVSFTAPDASASSKQKRSMNSGEISVEKNKKKLKRSNSTNDLSVKKEDAQLKYDHTRPAKTSIRIQDKNGKFYTEVYFFNCLEKPATDYLMGQSQESPDMQSVWTSLVEILGPGQAARIWREQKDNFSAASRRLSELKDPSFTSKKVRNVWLGGHSLFSVTQPTKLSLFPISQIINRLESLRDAMSVIMKEHPDEFRNQASIGWNCVEIVKDNKDPYSLAFLFVPNFWKAGIMEALSSFEKRKSTLKKVPALPSIPKGTFNLADAKLCLDSFIYAGSQLKNSSAKNVDIVDGSQQNERYNKNKIEFEATKSALLLIFQSLAQQAKSAINNK